MPNWVMNVVEFDCNDERIRDIQEAIKGDDGVAFDFKWMSDNTLTFQTAWSCPQPIFDKLAEMFPDVGITIRYADEDIGYNCGTLEYSDGELYSANLEPDASYDFALDVWGYDEEGKKEYLEEIGE